MPFKCNKLHQGNNHGQRKNRILEKQKGLTQRHQDAQINSNCIKQKKNSSEQIGGSNEQIGSLNEQNGSMNEMISCLNEQNVG